jgi:hypothetical protein
VPGEISMAHNGVLLLVFASLILGKRKKPLNEKNLENPLKPTRNGLICATILLTDQDRDLEAQTHRDCPDSVFQTIPFLPHSSFPPIHA